MDTLTLFNTAVQFRNNAFVPAEGNGSRDGTMAWKILSAHNTGSPDGGLLRIRFDAMASHDITYVGVIQAARTGGMEAFPLPYVLTNCHNSLCAVGGTVNGDDHAFGLSAARKYGGEYVPPHLAVIHQYMRERYAGGGRMILCSDSHTRYGPFGTLAVGEGGPELVKQLLGKTWDVSRPGVAAVCLKGTPRPGVGPQDVALALIGATFGNGFLKNKILEFIGSGIAALPMDFRSGIDVMTTETACLSSVWATDGAVRDMLAALGRPDDYKELAPDGDAIYDCAVEIDLSAVEPMIALPFHPSNAFTIRAFNENVGDLLRGVEKNAKEQWGFAPDLTSKLVNGCLRVDQGVVAGCAGGLAQNIRAMRSILRDKTAGVPLSVYPASQPMALALTRDGTLADLMAAGVTVRTAFCGPCFGAGDVPPSGGVSVRHTTRNFINREGSRPGEGQSAFVALMDARSIAATMAGGGFLTAAETAEEPGFSQISFDLSPYTVRVYYGTGKPISQEKLVMGPGIADWPEMRPLPGDLTLTVAAALYDPVTTTDELIPSGETSSYRSNPQKLASFTLSRRDPGYVGRCGEIGFGSAVVALRPGDGSAREQAASCQRVLGGVANIALEYATKRYRSNLINWGMLPFEWPELETARPAVGDTFEIKGLRAAVENGRETVPAVWSGGGKRKEITLCLPGLTEDERGIILAGCLMNLR
ncbi:MAG: hydratase [Oscillospiraceae bacterium]|jgi:aconitate hydratase|nr:hydratase [Oscillospiraceae bacterium]